MYLGIVLAISTYFAPPVQADARAVSSWTRSAIAPGYACLLFEESDFGMSLPTTIPEQGREPPPEWHCNWKCYVEQIQVVIGALDASFTSSKNAGALDNTRFLEIIARVRESAWHNIEEAGTNLERTLVMSPMEWGAVVRRACQRLLRADQFGTSTGYFCDAGLHLEESRDGTGETLITSLAPKPQQTEQLAKALEEFGRAAVEMRKRHMDRDRGDLRAGKGAIYDVTSTPHFKLARSRRTRIEEWRQLNRRLMDSVLAIATDAGCRECALDWRAAFLHAQNPVAIGSEDALALAAGKIRSDDVADWDAYLSALRACREQRDAAMVGLADGLCAARLRKEVAQPEDRGEWPETVRLDKAIDAWEKTEVATATLLRLMLKDQASDAAVALRAYEQSIPATAWSRWRIQADLCRPSN